MMTTTSKGETKSFAILLGEIPPTQCRMSINSDKYRVTPVVVSAHTNTLPPANTP